MTLTIYDAMKASTNPFAVLMLKQIATSDELFSILPFEPKAGEGFTYRREKSLGNFGFIGAGTTSIPQSTGTSEIITVHKREAVEDFYIANFAQDNLAGLVSPVDEETSKKFKVAGRKIANTAINGGFITSFVMDALQNGVLIDTLVATSAFIDSDRDGPGSLKYVNSGTLLSFRAPGDRTYGPTVTISADGTYTLVSDNPSKWIKVTLDVSDASADCERIITFASSTNEFDGLKKLVAPGQVLASSGTNGDAVSFNLLDRLLAAVKIRENRVFVMNAALVQKYESLMRAGGWNIPTITLPNSAIQVPAYKGIPLLTNDWIASTETKGSASTLSSVFCVSLSPDEGFYMGALGGSSFQVEADPRNASVLGFRLRDLGQIQSGAGSSFGRRLSWYGAPALGSDLAAARGSELITT